MFSGWRWAQVSTGASRRYICSRISFKHKDIVEAVNGLDFRTDISTYASLLRRCGSSKALSEGKRVHHHIAKAGLSEDRFLGNLVVDMYGKCGSLGDATLVFEQMPNKNVFTWTIMISANAQNGHLHQALHLYRQMLLEGTKPDAFTFSTILGACSSLGDLTEGKLIHSHIVSEGLELLEVVGTALTTMYGKCGNFEDARKVFDRLALSAFACTAMIAGYAQNGQCKQALQLYRVMDLEGMKPDLITFISLLDACASLAALAHGKLIHARVIENGLESDCVLGSALVHLYSRCGSLSDARNLFDRMPERNVVSWNAMIAGYCQHGHSSEALDLYQKMDLEGVMPTDVTFVSVLFACSHAGMLKEGLKQFVSMQLDREITPMLEHYGCMVDLLGRAGHLDEAEHLISIMPFQHSAVPLITLLGACKTHKDADRGERVAENIFRLQPKDAGPYVLLSNIYAGCGRWNDVLKLRKLMEDRGVVKMPGCSHIEINSRVHEFSTKDSSHPQREKILAMLQALNSEMKQAGYMVETQEAMLLDAEEEEKESRLWHHSEKLAIAFGLINTPDGTPLRVVKNLRVCADCHTVTKFISKLARREIIVRDSNRFHHFKHGLCSCGDYW